MKRPIILFVLSLALSGCGSIPIDVLRGSSYAVGAKTLVDTVRPFVTAVGLCPPSETKP